MKFSYVIQLILSATYKIRMETRGP